MRGVKDPEFLERITPTFICLISTAIWHGIRAWSTGTYVKPDHFQSQNESVVSKNPNVLTAMAEALRAFITALKTFRLSILDLRADIETGVETFNRMSNTWKGRSRQNQEATLEVIKDNLREKVCNGRVLFRILRLTLTDTREERHHYRGYTGRWIQRGRRSVSGRSCSIPECSESTPECSRGYLWFRQRWRPGRGGSCSTSRH